LKKFTALSSKIVFCFLLTWQITAFSHPLSAQTCTPVSATLSGSADDQLWVYINGNLITASPISFVTAPGAAAPSIPIPIADINSTGPNIIAAENHNLSPSEVLAAWVIDVTCSDGNHAYFSNTDAGYQMYNDTNGTAPPLADSAGKNWYDPSYAPASITSYFTGTPCNTVPASDDQWLTPMYNPATGAVQPFTSVNCTGASATGTQTLYYRGSFTLNMVAYVPPTFSIQKIAGFTSWPSSYSTGSEPYTLIVCNSGAPVNTPVTIWDTMVNNGHGGYDGAYPSYDGITQFYNVSNSAPTVYFTFPEGFGGKGACVTIQAPYANVDTIDGNPCSIVNNAGVSWNGAEQDSASVAVSAPCAPTFTDTNTITNTPTNTATVATTNTATETATTTATRTFTNTATYTATVTNTNTATETASKTMTSTATNTATVTLSSTATHTATNTATNTVANTATNTATETATHTETNSATNTVMNTATNTATQTATHTATNTATNTVVNTATNTLTNTATSTTTNTPTNTPINTNTYTNTPTHTASNTPTNTSTNTVANTPTNTLTNTQTSTVTNTPTNTPLITNTYTNTPTNTATSTPTNTSTNTVANTPTHTLTNTETSTITNTPTDTPIITNTYTNTPTNTATNTSTNTPFDTETYTNTPTNTATNSLTNTPLDTSTSTNTPTNTATETSTSTPTLTATMTATLTATKTMVNTATTTMTNTATQTPTLTPTNTPTIRLSGTPTSTPISTWTPTATPAADVFQVCKNVFNINVDGTVCIVIGTNEFPGLVALRIYNSAGEHIKTLFSETLTQPLSPTVVNWDGTNKFGQKVASGVYVIYLQKPSGRALGRLVVIH